MADDLAAAIMEASNRLGVNPLDLATTISYETGGTFNPTQPGPTTQWGQHRGLIQFGEPQAQKYLGGDFSVPNQMNGVVSYLKDAGVQPGMGLMDIYSAINAGHVGRNNASDANNGGAPGTVADKVNFQMAGHREKAAALLGGKIGDYVAPQVSGAPTVAPAMAMPAAPSFGDMLPQTIGASNLLGGMQSAQAKQQAAEAEQAKREALFAPVQPVRTPQVRRV